MTRDVKTRIPLPGRNASQWYNVLPFTINRWQMYNIIMRRTAGNIFIMRIITTILRCRKRGHCFINARKSPVHGVSTILSTIRKRTKSPEPKFGKSGKKAWYYFAVSSSESSFSRTLGMSTRDIVVIDTRYVLLLSRIDEGLIYISYTVHYTKRDTHYARYRRVHARQSANIKHEKNKRLNFRILTAERAGKSYLN